MALRHEHRPFDRVVQFADVARPGMFLQHLHRRRLKPGDAFAIPEGVLAEEVSGQRWDVFGPLAQGRQRYFDGVQTKQQIPSEPSRRDFRVHIGVGCGKEPDIGAPCFR